MLRCCWGMGHIVGVCSRGTHIDAQVARFDNASSTAASAAAAPAAAAAAAVAAAAAIDGWHGNTFLACTIVLSNAPPTAGGSRRHPSSFPSRRPSPCLGYAFPLSWSDCVCLDDPLLWLQCGAAGCRSPGHRLHLEQLLPSFRNLVEGNLF